MKVEDLRKKKFNISALARFIDYNRVHLNGVITGQRKAGKRLLEILAKMDKSELNKFVLKRSKEIQGN